MSNKELYKSTFSKLHTDQPLNWEEITMTQKKKMSGLRCRRSLVVLTLALVLVLAMGCAGYAATGGELSEVVDVIKIWVNGEGLSGSYQINEDGSYTASLGVNPGDQTDLEIEDDGEDVTYSVEESGDTVAGFTIE